MLPSGVRRSWDTACRKVFFISSTSRSRCAGRAGRGGRLGCAGGHERGDLLDRGGRDAGLREIHDAVGKHFRVDAEVVMTLERGRGGCRDRPDPELEGRAIRDEVRDVLAEEVVDLARLRQVVEARITAAPATEKRSRSL